MPKGLSQVSKFILEYTNRMAPSFISLRSAVLMAATVLTTSNAIAAECGATLELLNGDQAAVIDDISHLRSTKAKSVQEFYSCELGMTWCLDGWTKPSIHTFDKLGRLRSSSYWGQSPNYYRYRAKDKYPYEEESAGLITKYERGDGGRLEAVLSKFGNSRFTWRTHGDFLVVRTVNDNGGYIERGFQGGVEVWEISEGTPMITFRQESTGAVAIPSDTNGSPRKRVDCTIENMDDGSTRIVEYEQRGSEKFVTKETTLDSRGRVVRSWFLSMNPERAVKGIGNGTVRSHKDFDTKGNWRTMEICDAVASWDDLQGCRQAKRIIEYW